MMKKQKSLAIIDDGVHGVKLPDGVRITYLKVCGDKVAEDTGTSAEITHGALCAAIILRVCPKMPIISIKMMEQGTAGDIRCLCTALEWCLEHRIALVHMSVGTLVYELKDKLEYFIRKLVGSGTLVVAAFHNRNIPTWPASFPGVFGVRADWRGILPNRGIAFDNDFPGNRENSMIARIDESLGEGMEDIRHANSFAAPVVTARLAKMVLESHEISFSDGLGMLEREALEYPEKAFEGMYCRFSGKKNISTEKPVLWAEQSLVKMLAGEFKKEGYDITVFTDYGEGVPLDIYGQTGHLETGFVQIMSEVYPADALLFSTAGKPVLSFGGIDMYIMKSLGGIRTVTETECGVYESGADVFPYIREYFS